MPLENMETYQTISQDIFKYLIDTINTWKLICLNKTPLKVVFLWLNGNSQKCMWSYKYDNSVCNTDLQL